MIITIQFFERNAADFSPNHSKRFTRDFEGQTAAECMSAIDNYRNYHDLARYTRPEIINVAD